MHSSDHNTSRDLEFDKNVPRLVTRGAINLTEKQYEGNTLLFFEYLFYINNQVQMLKPFNTLLIQKFTVSAQGTSFQKQILFTIISTLSKNEQKINVGSFKISVLGHGILPVKLRSLNANLFFKEPQQLTKFT